MDENQLATIVVDLSYHIHKQYGPGLLESVYEEILCYELKQRCLSIERQKPIPLAHKEIFIPLAFRADLIVNNKLLIELKSVETLPKLYHKIVLTYLTLTNLKLALLINFNVEFLKDGVRRIVNNL
ncbi:MAG: GxxExxY protein [Flavisolibacter sp.]